MRLLFLASAMVLASAAAAAPPLPVRNMPILNPEASAPASCPATSRYEATKRDGRLKAQKLNQLPMADMYSAVLRHIGRCPAPIIVSYGIGDQQR